MCAGGLLYEGTRGGGGVLTRPVPLTLYVRSTLCVYATLHVIYDKDVGVDL